MLWSIDAKLRTPTLGPESINTELGTSAPCLRPRSIETISKFPVPAPLSIKAMPRSIEPMPMFIKAVLGTSTLMPESLAQEVVSIKAELVMLGTLATTGLAGRT